MGLVQWFWEDLYNIIFTLVTVVLSGIISLFISKHYFVKSNEVNNLENLRVSVIHPLIALLNDRCTIENYHRIVSLKKEYSIKYMPDKERQCLTNLCSAYKSVAYYDEDATNAKILFSYFQKCLSEQGVKWDPCPLIINDEIVDYEPPEGYFELEDGIARVLRKLDYHFEPDECQQALERLFNSHVRSYCSGQKVIFFKEANLKKVIKEDNLTAESKAQFENYQKCKNEFLSLPLIKSEMG